MDLFSFLTFDFENTATFKSGSRVIQGHIVTGTIQQIGYGFQLVFYRNFVQKAHRF